jgi:hypothetical protein
MTNLDFLELAKQFGPFVAFTVYFVWQGWQREKRQTARIDELANKYNESLQTTLAQTTAALANNTKAFERVERLISRICAEKPGSGCED